MGTSGNRWEPVGTGEGKPERGTATAGEPGSLPREVTDGAERGGNASEGAKAPSSLSVAQDDTRFIAPREAPELLTSRSTRSILTGGVRLTSWFAGPHVQIS